MEVRTLIELLGTLEKLKCNLRHSWTSSGRRESVAEHSWRLAVMALLVREEFPELDMEKVLRMCLIHDWGEAITGDIPSFYKSDEDETAEKNALSALLERFPAEARAEYAALFEEMDGCRTGEARLCRALDKLEVLIQHNEAGLDSWLELEYDLQLTYGTQECAPFAYTRALREAVKDDSVQKIAAGEGE